MFLTEKIAKIMLTHQSSTFPVLKQTWPWFPTRTCSGAPFQLGLYFAHRKNAVSSFMLWIVWWIMLLLDCSSEVTFWRVHKLIKKKNAPNNLYSYPSSYLMIGNQKHTDFNYFIWSMTFSSHITCFWQNLGSYENSI